MAKRVFLHVGTMKSATTYIQDLCDLNRRSLRKAGVLCRPAWHNFDGMHDLLGIHSGKGDGSSGRWKTMEARFNRWNKDVLLSNELLAPISSSKIATLVDAMRPAEVHVIITARDLTKVVPGQWQTGCRNRQTVQWNDFVRSVRSKVTPPGTEGARFWRKQDVAALVRRWGEHVPLDNITVVTVPPPGSPPTLLAERFGSVIGVDMTALTQPPRSNPSLGSHSAELLRRLNLSTKDWHWRDYQTSFKNALSRVVLAERAKQEPPIALGAKDVKWIEKRTETMIKAVKKTGVRVVGDLDDLIPSGEAPKQTFDPGASTDAELLAVAEDGVLGLGRLLADARTEYDRLVSAMESVQPIDQQSKEWKAFLAVDGSDDEAERRPGTRKGRFLAWQIAEQGSASD